MSTSPGGPRDVSVLVSRFVGECEADERVVAAFVSGSRARGDADRYSDLDLCVVTSDVGFDDAWADRETFVRRLGTPLFVDSFGSDDIVFVILDDGTEVELLYAREGALADVHVGPYTTLVDKRGVLDGVQLPYASADAADVRDRLCEILGWFWHDLSHLTAALGRGDLWWAAGQLEALRRYCVNLVRIEHGVEPQEEAYEKLTDAVPVSELRPLAATLCPMDGDAMVDAGSAMVAFFRGRAPRVASQWRLAYPTQLANVMSARFETLRVS